MNFIDQIVNIIIRPTRDKYPLSRLGPTKFSITSHQTQQKLNVHRQDFSLLTPQNKRMQVSYFNLTDKANFRKPCVIYLHGNSGSRCEGIAYVKNVLEREMELLVLDFVGSGESDGQYVTLGVEEAKNINVVVDYISKNKNVNDIFLWGRSMGAVAALLYLSQNPYKIQGALFDSPFSSLSQLIIQLTNQKTGIPKFLISSLLTFVNKSVQNKTGVNIQDLQISRLVSQIRCPGLFITSHKDKLVSYKHVEELFSKYNGPKIINYIDNEHHEFRGEGVIKKIIEFFEGNSFNKNKLKINPISFIQILDQYRQEEDVEMRLFTNKGKGKISLAELLRENPIEKDEETKTSRVWGSEKDSGKK